MQFELNILHKGVPYDVYASQLGIRAGSLHSIIRSPAHYRESQLSPQKDTAAMRFGRVFHSMVENTEKFRDTLIVEPEFIGLTKEGKPSTKSKEALDAKKAWYADLPPGVTVVTEEEQGNLLGMLSAITSHKKLMNMLKDSVREVSGWVKDPETGLTLQFRPDVVTRFTHLVDAKTTQDASNEAWLGKWGEIFNPKKRFYILGAAHYNHCMRVSGLSKSDSYTLWAIESQRPHGINIFYLDSGCLDYGEIWRSHLTKKIAECLDKNEWPAYPEAAVGVTPPEYPQMPDVWGLEN